MNRNRLANSSEIEAAGIRPSNTAAPLAARADPQVEAECAVLFRNTLAETRPICGCPAIVSR